MTAIRAQDLLVWNASDGTLRHRLRNPFPSKTRVLRQFISFSHGNKLIAIYSLLSAEITGEGESTLVTWNLDSGRFILEMMHLMRLQQWVGLLDAIGYPAMESREDSMWKGPLTAIALFHLGRHEEAESVLRESRDSVVGFPFPSSMDGDGISDSYDVTSRLARVTRQREAEELIEGKATTPF